MRKFLLFTTCLTASINAAETPDPMLSREVVATKDVDEHYQLACEAMDQENWYEAKRQFYIVSYNFPETAHGQHSIYLLGVSYFNLQEYDLANKAFSDYLVCMNNPPCFEQALEYKFTIANLFRDGARRHLFGSSRLPKWQTGYGIAKDIYDEIVASVPSHEMAAKALFSKGDMLRSHGEFRDSIEAYQMFIKRFPKHERASEAYAAISHAYLDLSRVEFQNPDILALAEINFRKFQADFPRDSHFDEIDHDVLQIKEVYANGLYETGYFYERINKPMASILYYEKAIQDFPDTQIAFSCRKRVEILSKHVDLPEKKESHDTQKTS